MTENMEQEDVLVIGGGPGGYSLGIAAAKKGLKVACGEGILLITELQMPGKRAMTAEDYLKGNKIETGIILK